MPVQILCGVCRQPLKRTSHGGRVHKVDGLRYSDVRGSHVAQPADGQSEANGGPSGGIDR